MKGYLGLLIACLVVSAHAEIKRTPSGKPDFSGVYDIGTLTPLNRPEAFGDNKFMTQDDAAKVVARTKAIFDFANRESDPNRGAPQKGEMATTQLVLAVSAGITRFGSIRARKRLKSMVDFGRQLSMTRPMAGNRRGAQKLYPTCAQRINPLRMTMTGQHRGWPRVAQVPSMGLKVLHRQSVV